MINEEFDRTINFIVQQQAQFTSDIVELRKAQAKTDLALDQAVQVITETGEIVTRLAYVTNLGFKEVNAKIDALVDAQIRTDAQLKRTDEQLKRTDEQLKLTIEQVNRTDAQLKRTDEKLKLTIEQVNRTDAQLKRTDIYLKRTGTRQRSTDEALRKLIRQLTHSRGGAKKE